MCIRDSHCRANITKGSECHHKLCHSFVVGCFINVNKVIGAKGHPDSFSFNAKLFSCLARFVLPVRNLLNALAPFSREIHKHDVCRHQNLPTDWMTNRIPHDAMSPLPRKADMCGATSDVG